jgi:rhodanese-related sulfurtransferase
MEYSFEIVDVGEARTELARGEGVAVDARSEREWLHGHVIGAIHLPRGESCYRTGMLDEGSRLIVIGEDPLRSAWAAVRLREQGFEAVAVEGGTDPWIAPGFNVPRDAMRDPYTDLGLE